MFNASTQLPDADLDRLLTATPTDAELDKLSALVTEGVMFTIRAEAAGADSPVKMPTAASKRGGWQIGLVAAAALSAGVTLGLAGVASFTAGGFATTVAVSPEMAVVGPVDLVSPEAGAPAVSVQLPFAAAPRDFNGVGIVAFEGVDLPAETSLAGVNSPFSDNPMVYEHDKAAPPRRLVAAVEQGEIAPSIDGATK